MVPIRIGVQYTPAPDQSIDDLSAAAVEIEAMGYQCFSLPDHLTRPRDGQRVAVADPVPLLARVAVATRTIDLGTMTLLDALRQPAQTLRTAATLQHLTEGRFELGIGAGWQQTDMDALTGTPQGLDGRLAALTHTLALVRRAWPAQTQATQTPSSAGQRANSRSETSHVGPADDQHGSLASVIAAGVPAPRLVVAAGSRRMLEMAAAAADTIALTVPTHRRLTGVRPAAASVAAQIAAARTARPAHLRPVGFHLQIRDLVATSSAEPDRDWWTLSGEPSQMIDMLVSRAAAGVTYFSLCLEDLRQLDIFATHVLPHIAAVN